MRAFAARVTFGVIVLLVLTTGIQAATVETVMRKIQARYNWIQETKPTETIKYYDWGSINGKPIPSFPPENFFDDSDDQATLVSKIRTAYNNKLRYQYYIETPVGKTSLSNTAKMTNQATTSTDIDTIDEWLDAMKYYAATTGTSPDEKQAYESDTTETARSNDGCLYVTHQPVFSTVASNAISNLAVPSTGECTYRIGVYLNAYSSETNNDDDCGGTYPYRNYRVTLIEDRGKIACDLTNYDNVSDAKCYIILSQSQYRSGCGSYGTVPCPDGTTDTEPVTVDGTFYEFTDGGTPTAGSNWTSSELFSSHPNISQGNYSKGWGLTDQTVFLEPDFQDTADSIGTAPTVTEKIYKNQDTYIVYSAAQGCGYNTGETVKGTLTPPTGTGLSYQVKADPYSASAATCTLASSDQNWASYTPGNFSITAKVGRTTVVCTIRTWEKTTAADGKVSVAKGDKDIKFAVKPNGYECCNRKETLNQGDNKPRITKLENDDLEIHFPDIRQTYIWGNGYFSNPSYFSFYKGCDFLDISLANYTPSGGATGEPIKLSESGKNSLVYSVDSNWSTDDTEAKAQLKWELDEADGILKTAVYDASDRLSKLCDATDPTNFYRQYNYDDSSNPDRVTSYTDVAGNVSRDFTLVYDSASGRLSGTIGGTGSGCGSCALGSNRLYTYDGYGNMLTESDSAGTVIYEYEYDSKDRLTNKWLGAKTAAIPIREVVYSTTMDGYSGAEIQDIYDYTEDGDTRLTRNILDTNEQVVISIAFDTLNINPSTYTDPNLAVAAGGRMTTYEYEYSGSTLDSISTKTPLFNAGQIYSYTKQILNNSSYATEKTILVTVDPNEIEDDVEVTLSESTYSDNKLLTNTNFRGAQTSYSYTTNDRLSSQSEPSVNQLNGKTTKRFTSYTYHLDGRIKTETVRNGTYSNDTDIVTTHRYNSLGLPVGIETRDHNGNLLYSTRSATNGFGETIYSIDKTGVARGKEYDSGGKVISEFVFANPNDTALFDGDDPNILTDDISSVYAGLSVISQRQYVYNSLGQLEQTKVAVADAAFTYDTPETWHVTAIGYDTYGRKNQQTIYTDNLPLVSTFEYNSQGQLIKTTHPGNRWTKHIHNGQGLTIKTIVGHGEETTEPNDFIVSETLYDVDGNVVKEIVGGEVISSYLHYDTGSLFRAYQGDYETEYCDYTEYGRDLDGLVTDQNSVNVDTFGNETIIQEIHNRYNILGQQIEQRVLADPYTGEDDSNDIISLFCYDFYGRPVETVIKGDGNSTIYTDSYKDEVSYQAGDKIEQSWYDASGHLEYTLSFEYSGDYGIYDLPFDDADEAFLYVKDSQDVYAVCYTYTDELLVQEDILEGFDEDNPYFDNSNYPYAGLLWHPASRLEHDGAGRIIKTSDADDNYVATAYNSRNQPVSQTLWQGKPILRVNDGSYDPNTFDPYPIRKTLIDYDTMGRKIRQAQLADPNSAVGIDDVSLSTARVIDTVYDDYGRLYRQRQYFDGANERIALQEQTYDDHGRIDKIKFGELEEILWIDGSVFMEEKFIQKTISYTYNNKGQKTSQTTIDVNTDTEAAVSISLAYEYDSQDRVKKIDNATGTIYTCKYDALGRKIEETDAVGKVTKYEYSPLGFMKTKIEDPVGLNRQTSFGFDRFGRQVEITSGLEMTEYAYSYLDQVTDVNYPSGDTLWFDYDMLGNAVRRTTNKDGESTAINYKYNALGRVSYKQYTNELGWTEPNSLLPFDEILYNAAGDKEIIAYMGADGNDLEINFYSYNYFGDLTGAGESGSDFSSSVSYGYDQRGLLKSISYPSEKAASYTRDALGRIESVTYDDKLIADYYYQGDAVVKKVIDDADIEYAATIDNLGRVAAEAYTDIPTSNSIISNTYGYTNHSYRIDERNTIDYTFDTLGKLTYEDTTQYTSDILGNPTNASEDNITYTFDDEERVTQANDSGGTLGLYEYDRLGRRNSKTVGNAEIHFVYDIFGNIIAEYEENGTADTWLRDYVYGAKGEVVYMQLPRTQGMNDEYDEFWEVMTGFAGAWLCSPNCTTEQLVYDCNDNGQIDLVDWTCIFDNLDLGLAFTDNGRYLLTDFHNSIIGMTDTNNNIIEITYDAWGTPTYSGNLEGLSIFWNGYYLDDETDNYYLRNRYYSPLERRFLTEDPHGINPDGNWNNPLRILEQYVDGYGLQIYAGSDPINGWDDWGLQKSETLKEREQRLWKGCYRKAHRALGYWHQFIRLRMNKTERMTQECRDRFLCIIRAVSWVESKHGTAGVNYPERDPMQGANPQDKWWQSLTGQLGRGDRFVGGPEKPNFWVNELPAGVMEDMKKKDSTGKHKYMYDIGLIDPKLGHKDKNFNQDMSYFWGVPYLIHSINTLPIAVSSNRVS